MNAWIFVFLFVISAAHADDRITVIVNASNPIESISAKTLSDYYFKIKREWSDGSTIRFIDRNTSSERKNFFSKILNKSEDAVDRYWMGQKLDTGRSAPVQSSSESMSIQFVATFKGAIGYISSSTPIQNKDIKTIKVEDQ